MYQYILFGGTTEGRVIARALAKKNVKSAVFVATEYGEQALEFDDEKDGTGIRAKSNAGNEAERGAVILAKSDSECDAKSDSESDSECDAGKNANDAQNGVRDVFARRIDELEMRRLFEEHLPKMVIDATHPYAAIVSGNISRAAKASGVKYVRVLRPSTSDRIMKSEDGVTFFQSIEQMVDWLNSLGGRIFSTLGAKDLPSLAKIRDFEKRVLVRILPTVEGISSCNELGFPMKHILGLHGPFSEEYNMAQYRANGADIVITKDTGRAGGFDEKVTAALKLGLAVGVLKRPVDEQDFVSLEEMLRILG